jgi:hypothetical protein
LGLETDVSEQKDSSSDVLAAESKNIKHPSSDRHPYFVDLEMIALFAGQGGNAIS